MKFFRSLTSFLIGKRISPKKLRGEEVITLLQDEPGQGMVEYALILLLIAIVVILVLTILGTQLSITYSRIAAGFP
jgi:pilus assembly protein Flp/PilA